MSETNTDFTRHAAALEAGRRLGGQAFETNKNRLMPCLEEAGLATVTVQFEGRGDFSQMGEVVAFDGDNITKELPSATVTIMETAWDGSSSSSCEQLCQTAIEKIAYMLLVRTHSGWKDNDGAYGTLRFNVPERAITLEYNERYTDTSASMQDTSARSRQKNVRQSP